MTEYTRNENDANEFPAIPRHQSQEKKQAPRVIDQKSNIKEAVTCGPCLRKGKKGTQSLYTACCPFAFNRSISYSFWRLRSRPRPRPKLDSCWPSSPVCCDEDPVWLLPSSPVNVIGRSSRCWHAHIPTNIIIAALANCRPHHRRLEGREWV